jgi:feruloyl esterase
MHGKTQKFISIILFSALFFLTSTSISSINGISLSDRYEVVPKDTADSKQCRELRQLTSGILSINTAKYIPANDKFNAHCRITGQLLPEVGFEVRLPENWNGRFLMLGNGGFAGEIQAYLSGGFASHINKGFAVAATDGGHDLDRQPLASFGKNRQKIIDFAYRAIHLTTQTAKQLITTFYGTSPQTSYFSGCSTGGRQGLMSAQRFPGDFDGILVGAPVLNQTKHHVSSIHIMQALAEHPISSEQLDVLAKHVYEKCDKVDGVEDGLIAEPTQCDFNPSEDLPVCYENSGNSDCFTKGQVKTLQTIYSDIEINGKTFFPGMPVGASATGQVYGPFPSYSGSGWAPYLINKHGPPMRLMGSSSFLKYMAFDSPKPEYQWQNFEISKDLKKINWIREVLDATDVDLSTFRDQGGKLLMYFGWADSGPNPLMGTDYYEQVQSAMGASTTNFFRLFMVPGMFHCRGGIGNPQFELFEPLQKWVETGNAPEKVNVSYYQGDMTRPLCPYPKVAHFTGQGSENKAENFKCVYQK